MFERLFRDLGADMPLRSLADGRLRGYFADFKAYRVLSEAKAQQALAEGKSVQQLTIERWTAQPAESQAVEVATKDEAVRLADELPGTWKHRRRGCYRVVPLDAQRPRRVSRTAAMALQAEGWVVKRRRTKPWMLVTPAAPQTRNTYRDIFAASFDYAVREGWLDANPLASVKRASTRHDHDRILRRDDFYDPDEINRLLHHAPSVFEEAFWLCGAHAGLRLPGEALGLRWGAVDFQTGVMRPYDNWVRNEMDTTKTSDSEAIPMTPRLTRALAQLRRRGYASSNGLAAELLLEGEYEPAVATLIAVLRDRVNERLTAHMLWQTLAERGVKPNTWSNAERATVLLNNANDRYRESRRATLIGGQLVERPPGATGARPRIGAVPAIGFRLRDQHQHERTSDISVWGPLG